MTFEQVLMAAFVVLCGFQAWTIRFVVKQLVHTNSLAYNGWAKATEHALAINEHERFRMQLELEHDRAEFLLREKRDAQSPSVRARPDNEQETVHSHDDVKINFGG